MCHDGVSSENDRKKISFDSLLEAASHEGRRILRAIQALAGTTSCKGVQLRGIKKWAIEHKIWFNKTGTLGIYADRGSENEVYFNRNDHKVYKLNDFRYADDNIEPFFERLRLHNQLFPDCKYTLEGFAENQDGKICAVISQEFIRSDREASKEEIAGALALMGFFPMQGGDYFSNGAIDIFDAVPNNVLHGIDGQFYFIDTIICPTSFQYFDSYRSLSPHYSSKNN